MILRNPLEVLDAVTSRGDVTGTALVIVQTGIIELCLTNGY
jgi:hypothetical protein